MIHISALNLVLILIATAVLSGVAGLLVGCCLAVAGRESERERMRAAHRGRGLRVEAEIDRAREDLSL